MQPGFFKKNRAKLTEMISGGVAVFSAYSQMQRVSDSAFAFEQEPSFWYLSGIEFADWWLIVDGSRHKSWLVSPDVSEAQQVFEGNLSAEDAKSISGVDGVLNSHEALEMLRDLSRKHSVAYALGDPVGMEYYNFHINPAIKNMWRRLDRTFNDVQDCRQELAKMRAIKQPEEITAIKKAIGLTLDAFTDVKRRFDDFNFEYEIEAEFSYLFRKKGARGHAYDPIVASGSNACTLHYSSNQARLRKGSLVLLDIGARYKGYAADITRTYAYGSATKYQKELHSAVESAHHEIIRLIKPGLRISEYHAEVERIMRSKLLGLGLIKSLDDEVYRRYFPHSISHGLGVEVHDPLGRPVVFEPGMLLTIEPGFYDSLNGVGVRIEDNVLVTDTGYTNLSSRLSTAL